MRLPMRPGGTDLFLAARISKRGSAGHGACWQIKFGSGPSATGMPAGPGGNVVAEGKHTQVAVPSVWLIGGGEMADRKGTTLARRSRPAQKVVSQGNKTTVALPFSMIRAEEPVMMRVGDWISLAGLGVSVIGFSVAIRELIRIATASEADQESRRAS